MSTTRITWQDAQLMPEDGKRYEAIDGELYVTPAPVLRHQWISGNLGAALRRLLMEPGHGWVFHAPVGVEFPETEEGVQPDIIFVSKARSERLVKEGIRRRDPFAGHGEARQDDKVEALQAAGHRSVLDRRPRREQPGRLGSRRRRCGAADLQRSSARSPGCGEIELSEIFPPELDDR
jgi:hypothetical protein